MTNKPRSRGTFRFEVDAGLLFQLGERLVARSSIALAELIKNAYDADATQVTVLLENVKKPEKEEEEEEEKKGTIIIEDDGSGMTFEEVRDHWMRIATDDKLRNPISPRFGRRRTGAKGVGRFAARRLADTLSLHSVAHRSDGATEQIDVKFEWNKQFQSGQALTSIPVVYERKTVSNGTPTGVLLLLEEVRDFWTEDDVVELRKDLLSLTSPFPGEKTHQDKQIQGFEPDPGFSVNLEVPEFPGYEGELREHFLEAARGVLSGWVDESGRAHYHLEIRETDDELDYAEDETRFAGLAETNFRIHYFVYRGEYFKEFDFGARDAIGYGRTHGGVRIYLDGFRVYGYAEAGEDWLRLNELRAERTRRPEDLVPFLGEEADKLPKEPLLLTPGNNQLFGAVFLSQSHHVSHIDKGERIELNIARDRLVENEAFDQLRQFLRTGIYWMTIQFARVRYLREEIKSKEEVAEPAKPIAPQIAPPLQDIERVIRVSRQLPPQQKIEISQAVTAVREAAVRHDEEGKRREEKRISDMSMLRVLASVGTVISFLNHQLRAILSNLGGIIAVFEIQADKVEAQAQDTYNQNISDLRRWYRFAEQQVDQLAFLLGLRARSELRPHNLRKVVDDVANFLEGYRMEFGIEFENQILESLISPPMYLAEIHAVFINIFTNALKAVRQQPERRIMVRGGYRCNEIYVQMLDTGKGLDISPELAFEPFTTTSAPDPVLGEGTGLGLYVVRSLLQTYNGKACFVEAPTSWRTCIEIVLPRR